LIKPLLIAKNENAGILKKALVELEHHTPRYLIGSCWSLKSFINSDLKSYMAQTHFVFDDSAFIERGDEFIELLSELREKHEKVTLIIYCNKFKTGDLFLRRLVEAGFTNVIAGYKDSTEIKNCELMLADLREALTDGLSEQKYERFFISEEPEDETVDTEDGNAEVENPENPIEQKTIAVFGSQRRVGTTTFAMSLCSNAVKNGGKAVLVLTGEDAESEQEYLCKHFNGANNDGFITVNDIDVFANEVATGMDDYSLVVFDCGWVQENTDKIEKMQEVDGLYLCCGIGWKDLKHVSSAHLCLQSMTYTVVVNTEDETLLGKYNEELCKNCNEAIGVRFDDVNRIVR